MSFHVRFTEEAQADIERLYDFLLNRDPPDFAAAERALTAITHAITLLEHSPLELPQGPRRHTAAARTADRLRPIRIRRTVRNRRRPHSHRPRHPPPARRRLPLIPTFPPPAGRRYAPWQLLETRHHPAGHNRTKAAAAQGITSRALRYKLKKLGID